MKLWLVVLLLGVVACSKDKSLEDYKNEQFAIQLAKLQAANGTYTGLAVGRDGGLAHRGDVLGALQLTLDARSEVHQNPDGTPATSTPTVHANLVYLDETQKRTIDAQSSLYYPDSGWFQAEIRITRSSGGDPETIAVSGMIDSSGFHGTIEVAGEHEAGWDVELARSGQSLSDLLIAHPPTPGRALNRGFSGQTSFLSSGVSKPVNFILQEPPSSTPAEAFLDLLTLKRPVQITFNYGDAAQINYGNGFWYLQDGTVSGQGTFVRGTQTYALSVECAVDAQTSGFTCQHKVNQSEQAMAITKAVPKMIKPTDPPPPDDSRTRDPVTQVFKGSGQFDPGRWTPITVYAIYPARTRLDEIANLLIPLSEEYLQFTFVMEDSIGTAVNFPSVKWDIRSGLLDATLPDSTGGHTFVRSLSCHDFHFDSRKYNFSCQYSTTLRPLASTLRLKN